jgi:hypothetical protein
MDNTGTDYNKCTNIWCKAGYSGDILTGGASTANT